MLVWCMLVVGLIDEMKNQHAQDDSQILGLFHKWYQSLAYNVDLTRYLVFVFCKCYLTNHGAKDGVQMATPIGIVLQRSILYTLASFGSYQSPKLQIHAYVQAFKSKLLAHMQRELMLPIWIYETCPYPLHMVKYLGKQHESIKILLNIFVKRLSSINKKGEIESPSLILDNR